MECQISELLKLIKLLQKRLSDQMNTQMLNGKHSRVQEYPENKVSSATSFSRQEMAKLRQIWSSFLIWNLGRDVTIRTYMRFFEVRFNYIFNNY